MPSVAIIVPTCDSYQDLWAPFFTLFRRHWPDCPYDIYVGSNFVPCTEPGVTPILVGDDGGWSTGLRKMLERMDHDYVLMILEDFFFLERVDTAKIQSLFATLVALDGANLRLRPFPPPDVRLVRYPEVGECEPGAPYRGSSQAGFWHRASLLELLRDGESIWEYEYLGARRSDLMTRGFYSTWKPALHWYAGVAMRRWIPYGVAICREQGVLVDLERRPMLSPAVAARRNLGRVVHEALLFVPWRLRVRLLRWWRATGLRRPRAFPNAVAK